MARASLTYRLRHQPLAGIGVFLLLLFLAMALLASLAAPYDPAAIDLNHRLLSPGHAHWFGTDELGRDVFSRILYGARISLHRGCQRCRDLAFHRHAGRRPRRLLRRMGRHAPQYIRHERLPRTPRHPAGDCVRSLPRPGPLQSGAGAPISGWVGYARLVRAQVLSVREREFVEAARALGASDVRIFTRHIVPNIVQPILVQAAIGMAGAVLAEATLSFLGLGIPAPAPSWGSMLNDARSHLFDSPHLVFFPALAVMGCVLSFNFIGDALRDYLDPRTRMAVGL